MKSAKHRPIALLTLLLAAACAPASATAVTPAQDCTDIRGTESIIAGHRIVMVGELHGTKEMPAMFARLVCAALARGNAVAAGLELPAAERKPLAAFLASDGGESARRSFLATPFWKQWLPDGRSSRAYVEMVESFRAMRRRGLPLTVFVLEEQAGAVSPSTSRDEIMAANVKRRYQANPRALVMTYSGNIHNMLNIPRYMPDLPAPMGFELRDLKPVSINLTASGGTAWNCQPECGIHAHPFGASAALVRDPALVLDAPSDAYSGHIDIGATTASPPAAATAP
ncbi:hypothetical protein Q4S45_04180 [Massilia sp. R2A-15]|uniref:hypothetical protein n=1 Tax=Massilia sp. R2A-15 TaxID=3064278 RepID=UPI00273293D0|nr:hypothetical protein [Massilia sp. R2A-15]WLI90330.1 hypothetical protein Q4S45_04180 [Massilia sp. R2A-15]